MPSRASSATCSRPWATIAGCLRRSLLLRTDQVQGGAGAEPADLLIGQRMRGLGTNFPHALNSTTLSRNYNPFQLLICNEDDMAANGLGGFYYGGDARIVMGAFSSRNMRLQHSEFLRQGALRELPPSAHDRQLGRKRKFGEQLGMLQGRGGVLLKQFVQMLVNPLIEPSPPLASFALPQGPLLTVTIQSLEQAR